MSSDSSLSPRDLSPHRCLATNAYLVVPCYNEELRLPLDSIRSLCRESTGQSITSFKIILVNDGSRDQTLRLLELMRTEFPSVVEVLNLPQNVGKGEAVRAGLLHAIRLIDFPPPALAAAPTSSDDTPAFVLGYADADFAAPASEVTRVLKSFALEIQRRSSAPSYTQLKVGLASRINLLGTEIVRTRLRHYLGRVFATMAAIALDIQVYDTQCGLKFFTDSVEFRKAIAQPFRSRWAFDVELISRLLQGGLTRDHFKEFPLLEWRDLGGSKLSMKSMAKAFFDLISIGIRRRFKN